MDKQTKLLLGLGALGVVLYILMKPKNSKDTCQDGTKDVSNGVVIPCAGKLSRISNIDYTHCDGVVMDLDLETCERYGGTFVPFQCEQAPCDGGTCLNATKTILF